MPSFDAEKLVDQIGLPAYSSPYTFLRAPHTDDLTGADIAFVGNSWDHTGYWNNGGTRLAPGLIRERSCSIDAFQNIADHPIYPFHCNVGGIANVVDLGDIQWGVMPWREQLWVDITIDTITKVLESGAAPLMCGGDHTIAVPMIRALGRFYDEPLACIHFDAHHDHFPFDDKGLHSGALMWAAVTEGWVDPEATIGLGYRGAFNWEHRDDFEFLWGHDLVRLGPTAVAEIVRQKVGDRPVWLTFDIDGWSSETIDGTSTLVPGGPNFHFVQGLLYNLQGINLVGADLSELNPLTASQSTAQASATAMVYMATLMAIARGRAPAVIEHDFG